MNGREKIKPKSIRLAILLALSDGAITTIDDLQTKIDEPRSKVANAVYPAVVDGLIKRLRDDVTNSPAYQITTNGRGYLVTYGGGLAPEEREPDTESKAADPETAQAAITPGVKVDSPEEKPATLFVETFDTAVDMINEQKVEIRRLSSELEAKVVLELQLIDKLTYVQARIDAWESMSKIFGCTSPNDVTDRIRFLAEKFNASAAPTGYVIQRPAKPLVRFTKEEKARRCALSFARGGQRAQVFALYAIGAAVPGSEWVSA